MKPLLSIGIIFRDEIRCLERCLKSLEPLRREVPCELVMADTGSRDGSRFAAGRYADILFDFPWTDDFAAARNAVMDRCSGEWYLTVDADEWLDADIRQLTSFLRADNRGLGDLCGVTVRNYATAALDWQYADFLAIRMVRMSTGLRYEGAVHESWDPEGRYKDVIPLDQTVLHHDGYVCLNDGSAEGREKLRRDMEILKKRLEEAPEDLHLLGQCVEAQGGDYSAQLPYLRRAVKLIREKREKWETSGPSILRHAVHAAHILNLPELKEWIGLAENLFPNSIYTTIDVQFHAAEHAWGDMDCAEIIRRGERYLKGAADYRAGRLNKTELLQSPVNSAVPHHETSMRAFIARAYAYQGRPEKALETLGTLDYDTMDAEQVGQLLETLLRIHSLSETDTEPFLRIFWAGITAPKPSREAAEERRARFITAAAAQFTPERIAGEAARMEGAAAEEPPGLWPGEWEILRGLRPNRHGYTLFRPLLGAAEVGTAAVLMDEEDPEKQAELLRSVKRFEELPIQALSRALVRGAAFPLPERPLNIEEMDNLAARLTQDRETLLKIIQDVVREDFAGTWQTLAWVRGLVLAAVRAWDWKADGSLELAKIFARVEKAFLPRYYAPELLREENLRVLPPLHRFGWHCARAFDGLEAGDAAACVRNLRDGLSSCGEAKDVVEFLLANMPELQAPPPSPELLALAEKVREILAMYPADDPAVAALKASPAYQRVAHLLEA